MEHRDLDELLRDFRSNRTRRRRGRNEKLPREIAEAIATMGKKENPRVFGRPLVARPRPKKKSRNFWIEFVMPMIFLSIIFFVMYPDLESSQKRDLANFSLGLHDPIGMSIVAIAAFLHIFILPYHLWKGWQRFRASWGEHY